MSRVYLTFGTGSEKLPADIALALIPSLPRAQLEQLVQRLVDRIDDVDGDPDLEDATDGEDDFALTDLARFGFGSGPGCILSDQDLSVDDQPCDDPFEDQERDEPFKPIYGTDQTAKPVGWRLK